MNRIIKGSLALAAFAGLGACSAFDLSGPKLDENPNLITEVRTPDQYFVAIQAAQTAFQESHIARTVCVWLQQCSGVDRQYSSLDIYSVSEDDYSGEWGWVYSSGGLIDERKLLAAALKFGDRKYAGIAKIMEALTIGTAAGVWGDIPYSEAITEAATPKLDKQLAVYTALQTLLDNALADLNTGVGTGPGGADLIYGGSSTLWKQAAWSLKARFYMATAEVNGTAAYTAANAAAKLGISSGANDFTVYHSTTVTESNDWWQFQVVSRDSYMRAGAALVDTLKNRTDPRLLDGCASGENWCVAYFDGTTGSKPGQNLAAAANLSADRLVEDFRQPIITWAEAQLIIAESAFRLGNLVEATTALNAVETAAGAPVTAVATLHAIGTQEWITMFQNIEAWSYYKRTCEPKLVPAPGKTVIPGRLLYPFNERNVNPNIPAPSAQPARNQNDPTACP